LELFKLLGKIVIDSSEANEALDGVSNKGEKAKSKLSSAFSKIGSGAVAVGKTAAKGLAVGGAAMGTLTVKSMSLAGELEQNMGGSEAVFKEHATKMQNTAKEAYANMGLSTSDYLATANKMGALFQGAGFSIEESMNLSSGAMQRAADVASIMGIDTSSAMEAIAGAAKGNFTMMDNLGVAMNDTTLNAYAAAKGINKTTQEMTNQEKIALAMEMFMEKTAYAAGNYAKENETLAGSLGTAKAALTNFLDGSGDVDQLVTSFKNLTTVIIKNLGELAPRLVSGISEVASQVIPELPPIIQKALPIILEGAISLIKSVAKTLPSLMGTLGSALMSALPTLMGFVGNMITGVADFIQTNLPIITSKAKDMVGGLGEKIKENLPTLISKGLDILLGLSGSILENIPMLVSTGMELIKSLVVGLVRSLPDLLAKAPTIISNFANTISNSMAVIFTKGLEIIWELIKGIIGAIPDLIKNIPKIIKAIFDVWNAVNWLNLGKNLITGISKGIKNMGGSLKNTASNLFTKLKDLTVKIFKSIGNGIMHPINSAKTLFSGAVTGIKNFAVNGFNSLKSSATSIFSKIKTAITNPIETAKNTIKKIVDTIKSFFTNLKIKFPPIKMPHFKITGEFSLEKKTVPHLSIEWYKKAMNAPMLLNDPTIFGYNPATGQMRGAGEAGEEVVAGASSLMRMIRSAVAAENDMLAYYLQKLIEMLADFFPELIAVAGHDIVTDDDAIIGRYAPLMDRKLGEIALKKGRGR
jgi:phage-related protein